MDMDTWHGGAAPALSLRMTGADGSTSSPLSLHGVPKALLGWDAGRSRTLTSNRGTGRQPLQAQHAGGFLQAPCRLPWHELELASPGATAVGHRARALPSWHPAETGLRQLTSSGARLSFDFWLHAQRLPHPLDHTALTSPGFFPRHSAWSGEPQGWYEKLPVGYSWILTQPLGIVKSFKASGLKSISWS